MAIIGITGGTGFVGTNVTRKLLDEGHQVIIFTRSPEKHASSDKIKYCRFFAKEKIIDADALAKCEAIIHLAGANVAGKRWTEVYKNEIRSSRNDDTLYLTEMVNQHAGNCKVFVSASGVGYYGPDKNDHHAFDVNDLVNDDFLGETCRLWENASVQLSTAIRRVVFRIGIVLGKESGAFPQFFKPIKMGILPVFGNGSQIISWIHITDITNLICYAIDHHQITGVYNAVSPEPVSQKKMMKAIAKINGSPAIPIKIPAFILKILLGEMSIEILKSCTVSSRKIIQSGFTFQYQNLENALKDLI